jgi:hypothetical protein
LPPVRPNQPQPSVSSEDSYLSYPSYPPLAPAPPISITPSNSQKVNYNNNPYTYRVIQAESTERSIISNVLGLSPNTDDVLFYPSLDQQPILPQNAQYKRQPPADYFKQQQTVTASTTPPPPPERVSSTPDKGPVLIYKSAYSSQDLSNNPPVNEPESIETPSGDTFYYVGEVQAGAQSNNVLAGPSAQGNKATRQQEVKYNVAPFDSYTPSPPYYKYPQDTPPQQPPAPSASLPKPQKIVYYRQEASTTAPPETLTPYSGAVYFKQQTVTGSTTPPPERVSTLSEQPVKTYPSPPPPSSNAEDKPVRTRTRTQHVDLGYPSQNYPSQGNFIIPEQFRTFLNTPPKWINMENW